LTWKKLLAKRKGDFWVITSSCLKI
jgi:hypothetical protein